MRDDDEGTDPVLPQLNVLDAYYPESDLIPVARLHGITSAFISPGDGNVFAGAGSLMHLSGRTTASAPGAGKRRADD